MDDAGSGGFDSRSLAEIVVKERGFESRHRSNPDASALRGTGRPDSRERPAIWRGNIMVDPLELVRTLGVQRRSIRRLSPGNNADAWGGYRQTLRRPSEY